MNRLFMALDVVSSTALVVLLFVIVESVIGRLIFNISGGAINIIIPAAIELAKYSLLTLVFFSIPRATISGLVRVDIAVSFLSDTTNRWLARSWDSLLAAFAVIIGYHFAHDAWQMYWRGDSTQDLGIPLYLIYGMLVFCSASIAVSSIWLIINRPKLSKSQENTEI